MIGFTVHRMNVTLLLMTGLLALSHLAAGQAEQPQVLKKKTETISQADELFRDLRWRSLVKNIEEARESRRIWFKDNKLTSPGDSMVAMIADLRYYGLLPDNYHRAEIENLKGTSGDLKSIFRLDVLLTDAFFSVAEDLKNGRIKSGTGTGNDSLLTSLLDHVTRGKSVREVLEQQEPDYSQYRSLKQALRALIDTLEEGERTLVKRRIALDSLSLQKQLESIEINMERWRQEKQPFKDTYVLINIPSFMLELIAHDTVTFESKVIVGKAQTPTPILSSQLECFIIYPYWHVPKSIASAELLPKIQKDVSYLTRNNFEVLDSKGKILDAKSINWAAYNRSNFPFVLRQQEGTDNALGIIKFVFDSPSGVYLHDTNTKDFFKNEVRAYSHGCIRLEKAEALALLLATGTSDASSPLVEKYLQEKKRNTINLSSPVPIYVRYFTCEYKNGNLHQYPDIYKRDAKIFDALYK